MTVIDYSIMLARIIRGSSRITTMLIPGYGEKFTVSVGSEQDRTDFQRAAPYAFFYPVDEDATPENTTYTVRMELGLVGEAMTEAAGVPVLACYRDLGDLVPVCLRRIAEHLPGMASSTVHLRSYRSAYDQESFPLVKAVVDIEITELTPVGRRSVI